MIYRHDMTRPAFHHTGWRGLPEPLYTVGQTGAFITGLIEKSSSVLPVGQSPGGPLLFLFCVMTGLVSAL